MGRLPCWLDRDTGPGSVTGSPGQPPVSWQWPAYRFLPRAAAVLLWEELESHAQGGIPLVAIC